METGINWLEIEHPAFEQAFIAFYGEMIFQNIDSNVRIKNKQIMTQIQRFSAGL
jgi:hypothetical protein